MKQIIVETKIDDNIDRPAEDSATMFAFVKQVFYHKALAYTQHEKSKRIREGNMDHRCC
jgi:hypothetical protein